MKLNFDCKFNFDNIKEIESKIFHISEMEKSVLFVVDMNNGFAVEGALSSSRIKKIIPHVVQTVDTVLKAKSPVIAFTDSHSENASEFKYLPKHCIENTNESELVNELLPYKKYMTVIGKNSTNGFMEDEAKSTIDKLIDSDCQNWIITGCCTDICVKTFAITLKTYFNKNDMTMNIIVPIDSVETYDGPYHDADFQNLCALYDMQMNGINLVSQVKPAID